MKQVLVGFLNDNNIIILLEDEIDESDLESIHDFTILACKNVEVNDPDGAEELICSDAEELETAKDGFSSSNFEGKYERTRI